MTLMFFRHFRTSLFKLTKWARYIITRWTIFYSLFDLSFLLTFIPCCTYLALWVFANTRRSCMQCWHRLFWYFWTWDFKKYSKFTFWKNVPQKILVSDFVLPLKFFWYFWTWDFKQAVPALHTAAASICKYSQG